MAERWANWYRKRQGGDVTSAQQAQGRKVLGLLMEQLRLGELPTGVLRWEAPDGTLYIASYDGTTPIVEIVPVPGAAEEAPTPPIELWIPEGFVFVPGDTRSVAGWGLPVIDDSGTADLFAATNIDPGLDVGRWTSGGPCGQVLLTRQDTTRYPDPTRRHIPLAFDIKEWVVGAYTPPNPADWHVVRPRFNDFGWSPDTMGARRGLWNALQAAQGKPVSLPFAGFYDDAQLIADLGTGYGADPSQWPLHYTTEAARANADGIPKAYDEAWTFGDAGEITAALGTFHDGCPTLDAGVRSGLKVATLRTQDTWLHAGNQFWHPADPTLPTLSWDGYPAQNLPLWLVQGNRVDGTPTGPITPLEDFWYPWRGDRGYVYSKRLYAMGRCIGELPETVVSAAIRTETVNRPDGSEYRVRRVVVVTWNRDDQYGDGWLIAYLWSFNVWYADFPLDGTLPLHLTHMPVGVYDETSNPDGWRRAGSFTSAPGSVGGSLPTDTIWQFWRFNGDGTRAIAAWGPTNYSPAEASYGHVAVEVVFDTVAENALSVSMNTVIDLQPERHVIAADYDADGSYVWVSDDLAAPIGSPNPLLPLPDGSDTWNVSSVLNWSKGGASEIGSWVKFTSDFINIDPHVIEVFVLDACNAALMLVDHWLYCPVYNEDTPASQHRFQVRMCHRGARIYTSVFDDPIGLFWNQNAFALNNDLQVVKPSYVVDRHGNWMMGYDFEISTDMHVYDQTLVCGGPWSFYSQSPNPSARYMGSVWRSNAGNPAELAGMTNPMRAFPLGVI